MFRENSKIMKILSRIADLLIVNMMAIACCVPIITIGAALAAAYSCIFKLRENRESYLWKDFFNAFKENFKQATAMWLLVLLMGILFAVDYYLFRNMGEASKILQIAVLAAGAVVFCVASYAFPMQSYFINPVKATIRNAALIAVGKLPYTLAITVINIVPFVLMNYLPATFGVYLVLGISGIAWINSFFLLKIFDGIKIVDDEGNEIPREPDRAGVDEFAEENYRGLE